MNEIGIILALLCAAIVIYAVRELVLESRIQQYNAPMPVLPFVSTPEVEIKEDEEVLKVNLVNALVFEKFVVSKFDAKYFQILDWRSDKSHDGKYPLSNLYPDIEFAFRLNELEICFAVECKWRKNFYNNGFAIKSKQVNRYFTYQKSLNEKVFIVLGVGGTPNDPSYLYVIPLSSLNPDADFLSLGFLDKFYKNPSGNFFFDPTHQTLK